MRLPVMAVVAASAILSQSPFACNLKALSAEERQRHSQLMKQLVAAVVEQHELENGYAFRVSSDRFPITALADWTLLEQKCCPFFGFELRLEAEQGPLWLHLTGRPGVKEFIREEFKIK